MNTQDEKKRNEYARKYYEANKVKILAKEKSKYDEGYKVELLAKARKRRAEGCTIAKDYYNANKVAITAKDRLKYYEANKASMDIRAKRKQDRLDGVCTYTKEYREANKVAINARRKKQRNDAVEALARAALPEQSQESWERIKDVQVPIYKKEQSRLKRIKTREAKLFSKTVK